MTENIKSVNVDPIFIDEIMNKFNSENKRLRFIICTTILNLIEERDTLKIEKKQAEVKVDNLKHKYAAESENMKKEYSNNLENQRKIIKEKDNQILEARNENKNLLKKIDMMTIDNIRLSAKMKGDRQTSTDKSISPIPSRKSPLSSNKSPNSNTKSNKSPISISKSKKSPISNDKKDQKKNLYQDNQNEQLNKENMLSTNYNISNTQSNQQKEIIKVKTNQQTQNYPNSQNSKENDKSQVLSDKDLSFELTPQTGVKTNKVTLKEKYQINEDPLQSVQKENNKVNSLELMDFDDVNQYVQIDSQIKTKSKNNDTGDFPGNMLESGAKNNSIKKNKSEVNNSNGNNELRIFSGQSTLDKNCNDFENIDLNHIPTQKELNKVEQVNNENIIMTSIDSLDLENQNKKIKNEVKSIERDNDEQVSPKKHKLFTRNKQLNVDEGTHFTFSKKDIKNIKRSMSAKNNKNTRLVDRSKDKIKEKEGRSRSKTPLMKKEFSYSTKQSKDYDNYKKPREKFMQSQSIIKTIGDINNINKKLKNNLNKAPLSSSQTFGLSKHYVNEKKPKKESKDFSSTQINFFHSNNSNSMSNNLNEMSENNMFRFHHLQLQYGMDDSTLRKVFTSRILKELNVKKDKIDTYKDGSFKDEFFENQFGDFIKRQRKAEQKYHRGNYD